MLTIEQLQEIHKRWSAKKLNWNQFIDGAAQRQFQKDVLPKMENVFADISRRKAELEKELREHGEELLRKHFTQLFDAVPDLVAVRWNQYTPYFNDGEPCEFGVHDWNVKFQNTAEDAGDYGDGFDYIPYKPKDPKYHTITEFQDAVPESVMLATFGDHTQITATREGFEVEEYSHD